MIGTGTDWNAWEDEVVAEDFYAWVLAAPCPTCGVGPGEECRTDCPDLAANPRPRTR